jgi:hypothetical protein
MEQIHPQRTTEMPEEFKRIRENLLQEFPKERVEGINLRRVEEFIKDRGLEIRPYIIIGKDDFLKMQRIVDSSSWESFLAFIGEGGIGLYDANMDLVVVFRDDDRERVNGEIFTERFLVHELAHASTRVGNYTAAYDRNGREMDLPHALRTGFCLRSRHKETGWGELIEEGWAEMQSANYFAQCATKKDRMRVESAVGQGSLDVEDTIPTGMALGAMLVNVATGKPLPLPAKYVFLDSEGKPQAATAAPAGFALEILCRNNSSLAPAMIEARKSVEGLRKFARILYETSPELYKKLQVGDYSAREFRKKLEMVIDKVGGGIEKVIRAEGPLKEKWDKILKR